MHINFKSCEEHKIKSIAPTFHPSHTSPKETTVNFFCTLPKGVCVYIKTYMYLLSLLCKGVLYFSVSCFTYKHVWSYIIFKTTTQYSL